MEYYKSDTFKPGTFLRVDRLVVDSNASLPAQSDITQSETITGLLIGSNTSGSSLLHGVNVEVPIRFSLLDRHIYIEVPEILIPVSRQVTNTEENKIVRIDVDGIPLKYMPTNFDLSKSIRYPIWLESPTSGRPSAGVIKYIAVDDQNDGKIELLFETSKVETVSSVDYLEYTQNFARGNQFLSTPLTLDIPANVLDGVILD